MNLYDRYTDALEKVAKNVPTSPEKWARAKSAARAKFDVYPSAYANGWAAKKYKEMGGGWKKEAELNKEAFLAGLAGRTILGAGRLLKKPVSRLMLGKKSLSPQKRGAHLMKRVGQVGTAGAVVGGAASLTKRVANKKISTVKAPSVNTAAPPPSIQ
jgi:hypothetical protein